MTRCPAAVALLLAAFACHRPQPEPPVPAVVPVVIPEPPAPISNWPQVLTEAIRSAEAGDYASADRALLDYSMKHAGAADGAEADYWRAVFRADPSNGGTSLRERIALFDAYLAPGTGVPRFIEATVMRRLLESTDSVGAVIETVRANTAQRLRAREEEIRRLTDELDRMSAELERIRKRLAPGKVP